MKNIAMWLLCLLIIFLPTNVFAQKRVPILIYHSIDEFTGQGSKELYVTPKNFEEQMKYLRDHGFTLLTFERWKDINTVKKPIFITFDDGYKNNLHAYAIFQKLKNDRFKPAGTIFVISDFIGGSNRLSAEDLKRMADSELISIQSHTATHPNLKNIQKYEYELKESKDKIEKVTGKPVIALAYPYGDVNEKVIAETKKYYKYGLTTTPGPFIESGIRDELYQLPRIYIKYSTTLNEFAKILHESRK
ncbi:MAG TPA: polysaccharide deacetylase family protein [Bacillus sp. (in: firmicutes)]|jgi:peptidoglycan/xylan/chitin deacetylase (PgdA/CDA1 family)